MGACTSSPAKEDARPLQAMNKVNPLTSTQAAKPPLSSPSTTAPSPATLVQPQPPRAPGVPGTSTPLANEVGAAHPVPDATDLTAFLNDGPVSPTQADVAAGAGSNGHSGAKMQRDRSHTADKQNGEENRKFTKECKLLLLGKQITRRLSVSLAHPPIIFTQALENRGNRPS